MGAGAGTQGQSAMCSLYERAAERSEKGDSRAPSRLDDSMPMAGNCTASTMASSSGIAVVGENEDGVDQALAAELEKQEQMFQNKAKCLTEDQELALELSKQEQLFQKCLRRRAEREQQKKLEKEERRAALQAQKEQALEAAFDNEVDALLALFDKGIEPDLADDHGTTLLSEACAGGAADVVEVLLGEGCDPNSVGRYRRTPLWRAAYAGQAELIRALLRSGSDPRETDEQGARPFDVASNAPSKELLLCWDISATEKIQEKKVKDAKKVEKEQKEKVKRQMNELDEALEEAERKAQIAKSELARSRKLLGDYRQQKVSLVEQGGPSAAEKLAELEHLLEGTEAQVKLFETAIQEWEWKAARAKLKKSDFEQGEKEKAAKKAGKHQGFKVSISIESLEQLASFIPHVNNALEMTEDFEWGEGEGMVEMRKGDTLIKEAPFSHLTKSQFNKKMLEDYGKAKEPEEGEEAEEAVEEESPFPLALSFSRGFSRTIPLKSVSDVLMKDVGGLIKEDGRWPLVIDPSGKTSTFITYTGAAVFNILELQGDDATMRLRRAFLNNLQKGGCLLIDLGNFDMTTEAVAEAFNNVEKGLFSKLCDRSVLYSYLLPRRFKSLIPKDLEKEFPIYTFTDEAIQKFVFGFVTSFRDPAWEFAKQFYTISVKSGDEDEA
eukprot:TRINITY_DN30828_c0_g1_i1.p1 TRINITY_DN30828_c0_g1~~TRINITY_DN30828_c0_g1_i1.p1  ORF type:complete len:667 (+),score=191.20 TRINITY_DN30828_c0_g1_i1:141-2141(+)